MRNLKLIISYDGTRYNGWQKQGNTENTIQGKLTGVISAVCGEEIELIGSGRTDAGVHALNQIAGFKTTSAIPAEALRKAINEKLSGDICLMKIEEADYRFHARYNASSKKYLYNIWNHDEANVFKRKFSYHLSDPLNIEKMKAAANLFIGSHDFSGFSSDKRTKKSKIKTIYSVSISDNEGMLELLYHGNSFLYNMVRIMTGTLIEIGLGRLGENIITDVLTCGDRSKAGFTAPPHGLFLKEVIYEK